MKTKIYFIGIALAGMWLLSGCHTKEEMSYSADPVTNIEGLWQIIDTRYCYIEDKGIDLTCAQGCWTRCTTDM